MEAPRLAQETAHTHAPELTTRGVADAATAAVVALGEHRGWQKAAKALAADIIAMLQVAHEETTAANKRARASLECRAMT